MIPKENICNKDSLQEFDNIWNRMLQRLKPETPFNPYNNTDINFILHDSFREIVSKHLIIPLHFNRTRGGLHLKDKEGCRIHDWKILSTPQVKQAMQINGDYRQVKVAYVKPVTMILQDNAEILNNYSTVEEYNKFLNVTYLINDSFLQNWINPCYEEKNVAKKEVKDCSVSELLFAIKKKLDE